MQAPLCLIERRLKACTLVLALLVSACAPEPPSTWSGYAEADYLYVAAPLAGRLQSLHVQVGQNVVLGDALFQLDAQSEQTARMEAAARLRGAQAQVSNLSTGRRPQELLVSREQLAQAQAQAALARSELGRAQALLAQGFVAKARVDDANSLVQQTQARVREFEAVLRVAQLPARADEQAATQAQAAAAREVLRQSDWRAAQKQQSAPQDALVAEVFFQVGEQVGAGQPVLSLLPPASLKARFYVPESVLSTLRIGQRVQVLCNACPKVIDARISRIASSPEYTPPVIYSNAQRQRLVYMVEARPDALDAVLLRPGQPLDVRLPMPP